MRLPLALALALLLAAPALAQPEPETTRYVVVINHEEQYAVWPAGRDLPEGWRPVGEPTSLAKAHAVIEEVWTDMRPLSLRRAMDRRGIARDEARYVVVINHEEQYALALAGAEVERPWRPVGEPCAWAACHATIEEVWTDRRPLSVRGE